MDVTLDVVTEQFTAVDVIEEKTTEITVVTGVPGADGAGVVPGGTTGQVLTKKSNTNFDTEWTTVEGVGGGVTSVNGKTGDAVLTQDDVADGTTAKQFTAAEKTKLSGIASGAQVNAVTSVAGKTGAVTVSKSDVGLSNVDNTSDANKPISSATQTALNGKAATSHTHTSSQITDFNSAVDARIEGIVGAAPAALDTLEEIGDALNNDPNFAATMTTALAGKASASDLSSHTGNTSNPHNVTKAQVGLGNVDNTSDTNKPISTATQTALNGKANTSHTHATSDVTGLDTALAAKAPLNSPAFTGTPTGITKAHVGLGNVDNTSDANKPVSTAQQAAIDKTPAVIIKSGGAWPARSTVTSNTSRTVWFIGAAPGPTDAQAVDI